MNKLTTNIILVIVGILFIIWVVRQLTKRNGNGTATSGRYASEETPIQTERTIIQQQPVFVPYIVPVNSFGRCRGERNPDQPVFYRDGKAYCFERRSGNQCFYRECSVAPPPNTGTSEIANPVIPSVIPSIPTITTI